MRLAPLAVVLAGSLLGCLLHPAAALAAPELVAHGRGGRGPTLLAEGANFRLDSGGLSRPVELPRRASVGSVETLGNGWLISGSAPGSDGNELFFLRGDDRSEQTLPAPPARVAKLRQTPVPFVADARLLGAAWLEGPEARQFEVRFSAWQGDRFADPEVVAPAGPGSQLALAGARLADGRLLLVWAGFDGEDDEIWVSSRAADVGSGWSTPVRAADDNATPDITPAVAPLGSGALLAWSRFDGSEYRLMTARFDGERVTGARYAAPPGTLYPSIEPAPEGLALLFRDARSSSWTVAELDAEGALGRSARIESESDVRPAVRFEGGSVLWNFGDRGAVSDLQ